MSTVSQETRLLMVATVAAGLRANPCGNLHSMSSLELAGHASCDVDAILGVEKVRESDAPEHSMD